ncbi:MAG: hypothetical protein JWQ11_3981 [Rhizobacter sp.]|nr:hypothetical protein [Rhizobacter sp.]
MSPPSLRRANLNLVDAQLQLALSPSLTFLIPFSLGLCA